MHDTCRNTAHCDSERSLDTRTGQAAGANQPAVDAVAETCKLIIAQLFLRVTVTRALHRPRPPAACLPSSRRALLRTPAVRLCTLAPADLVDADLAALHASDDSRVRRSAHPGRKALPSSPSSSPAHLGGVRRLQQPRRHLEVPARPHAEHSARHAALQRLSARRAVTHTPGPLGVLGLQAHAAARAILWQRWQGSGLLARAQPASGRLRRLCGRSTERRGRGRPGRRPAGRRHGRAASLLGIRAVPASATPGAERWAAAAAGGARPPLCAAHRRPGAARGQHSCEGGCQTQTREAAGR